MIGAWEGNSHSRSERTLCLFGLPTTVGNMGYCLKNVRSFAETGQSSEQKLLNSPTLATKRKPVVAIAFDKMTAQRQTLLITRAVFSFNGKKAGMYLAVF